MLNNIIAMSLFFTVILGTAALSGVFSEKAGVVNIAIDGLMIFGALFYGMIGKSLGASKSDWTQLPMYFIVGLIVAGFSMLHAFASITLKANQVISGTAINLLAAGVALFIIMVVYKLGSQGLDAGYGNISPTVSRIDWRYGIALPVFLCFGIILVAFLFLKYTKLGLRIRAAGENPQALASQGVSVVKIRYIAVAISGFLAGLAGSVFAQLQGSFRGDVQGLGFVALAIMIFGQWRIPLIVLAAILFSVLNSFSGAISAGLSDSSFLRDNSNLFRAIPFILSLVTLVATSRNSQAPKVAGIPYDKAQR